jgi:hypothetical protein
MRLSDIRIRSLCRWRGRRAERCLDFSGKPGASVTLHQSISNQIQVNPGYPTQLNEECRGLLSPAVSSFLRQAERGFTLRLRYGSGRSHPSRPARDRRPSKARAAGATARGIWFSPELPSITGGSMKGSQTNKRQRFNEKQCEGAPPPITNRRYRRLPVGATPAGSAPFSIGKSR